MKTAIFLGCIISMILIEIGHFYVDLKTKDIISEQNTTIARKDARIHELDSMLDAQHFTLKRRKH
jgi:hypothetical protein